MNSTIFIREGIYYKNHRDEKIGPAVFLKDRWLKHFKWHWEISGELFDDYGSPYSSPILFGDMIKCELDSDNNSVEKIEDPWVRPDENYIKDVIKEFLANYDKLRETIDWNHASTDEELNYLESCFLHQSVKRMKQRAFLCRAI